MMQGEYRMYCKPEDGEAFSYGLIISDVNLEEKIFSGRPRAEGKYKLEDGSFTYDEKTGRLNISYTEVWPDGTKDMLQARVKSNGKFQCESTAGFEQKASNVAKNFPEDPADRIGEDAKAGIKKYYLGDQDHLLEQVWVCWGYACMCCSLTSFSPPRTPCASLRKNAALRCMRGVGRGVLWLWFGSVASLAGAVYLGGV